MACDRYFTTLSLAIALLKVKKWLVGTMQTNRKGFPKDLDVGKHTDIPRGTSASRVMHFVNSIGKRLKIFLTYWQDSKPVYILHTAFSPRARSGQAYRWIQKTIGKRKQTSRMRLFVPESFIMYNKIMGGVDKFDHLRAMYTIDLKLQRLWTLKLFWWVVEAATVNAYIVYNANNPQQTMTHKEFRAKLCKLLMEEGRPYANAGTKRSTEFELRYVEKYEDHMPKPIWKVLGLDHTQSAKSAKQRHCVVCNMDTTTMCPTCRIPMCTKEHRFRLGSTYQDAICCSVHHTVEDYSMYKNQVIKKKKSKQ